jgi:MFS family permease
VSGFAWSGFNLAGVNFVYDASEAQNRTKHIAVFNAITCLATFLGALIGGYLVPLLPQLFGYQLLSLFTISGILRGLVALLLARQLVEVRRVPDLNLTEFMMGRSGSLTAWLEPTRRRDKNNRY